MKASLFISSVPPFFQWFTGTVAIVSTRHAASQKLLDQNRLVRTLGLRDYLYIRSGIPQADRHLWPTKTKRDTNEAD